MNRINPRALAVALLIVSTVAIADDKFSGFLCCNLRTDGSWISDINYDENGKRIIPAGTPLNVTGYGRYRVHVEIDGKKQSIGNDYSRDMGLPAFAQRYVVAVDPRIALATYPKAIQDAITTGRLVKGMTREQVLMSVGYPVSSENPHLEDKIWRFWRSSFVEFSVLFDDNNRVADVKADFDTRARVLIE